jgi:hypothetical protein
MRNLAGYNIHLFIKHLGISSKSIKVISHTDEKYITVSTEVEVGRDEKGKPIMRELRFIDSFKHMSSSLDSLLSNLKSHPNLEKFFQCEQLELLLTKGVYPYEYVNNVEVFDEIDVPHREGFKSQLNSTEITDAEYEYVCKVWKEFGCKTFRDYHEIYNRADVLQLADVLSNYRGVCLKNYKLDPLWYYTSPGLAWDACLKLTGIAPRY